MTTAEPLAADGSPCSADAQPIATKNTYTGADRPFRCPVDGCAAAYRRREHLQRHAACAHSSARPFVCAACGRAFALAQHLHRHEAAHGRTFVCEACGLGFGRRVALRRHVRAAHGPPDAKPSRAYACVACDASFSRWSDLVSHRRSLHQSARPARRFPCAACAKEYATRYGRREHERLAHGGDASRYRHACGACPAVFCHRRSLGRHVARVHAAAGGAEAGVAPASRASPAAFDGLLGIGTRERMQHACAACARLFRRAYDLRRHVCGPSVPSVSQTVL